MQDVSEMAADALKGAPASKEVKALNEKIQKTLKKTTEALRGRARLQESRGLFALCWLLVHH